MSGLLRKKEFNGSGSRVIFDFIEEFQEEFKERIFKYAEAKLPYLDDGGFEHGFYYGEQQTKTFVTSSLDSICNSEVMQEYSVDRRKKDDKEESDVEGNGNVDYWCRYGVSTKTSILIEVKQSWIRYYDKKSIRYIHLLWNDICRQ
ncbi:MAG: hypothetical protein D6732_03540 [Methanobacteriota archaeon]|nr:MAG: hypothetical protein D6732_03540 [Euryarchaeota archaeon]